MDKLKASLKDHPKTYCPVFGNYPREYNRAVHGPYYPWVNYGPKPDKMFRDVKLGELTTYLKKMDKTPQALIAGMSRQYYKWVYAYCSPKYATLSKPGLQMLYAAAVGALLGSYGYYRAERNHKYHW